MRALPSLRGIQAFEAVARLRTLAAAADFLGITPSAVSHRVRGLEKELGVQLLKRSPKGLSLTDAGRRYRGGVEDAFAGLAQATADLLDRDTARPLTISLTSEVGMRWLMPRFHRFRAQHPDVDTAILSTYRIADLQAGEADLALRYGNGQWTDAEVEPVLEFSVSPVCTSTLQKKVAGLTPADALKGQIVIRDAYDDWDLWFEAAGMADFEPSRQLHFMDYSMAVTAALAGEGFMLGYSGYVDQELASGTLVQPFDLTVPTGKGYHLVYRRERLSDPRVRKFRDWVLSETARAPAPGL
ncbi:LysR substrate-binding domain-containing protein [Pelagibius sp.]|uniref:LysR substrate-binding domain-containing protein n=1 Tax=Pelagibius sp. TaxID=1931238 RepID=UPI0026274D23|nr:LysR substrate-binding domain-containing protein [Pelagibius sp.]